MARRYKFYFEWQENIKFISSSQRVMFFLIIWRLNIEYFRFYCVIESIVVFGKMPVDALVKRSEGRGFVFFTIFLSHSKNNFFLLFFAVPRA